MTEAMSGVRWSGPVAPTVVQGAGDQGTAAVVLVRSAMLPEGEANVGALSASWPRMVREVAVDDVSSTWNWT